MNLFRAFCTALAKLFASRGTDSEQHGLGSSSIDWLEPKFNVDGTPMMGCVDVRGKVYGDSGSWMSWDSNFFDGISHETSSGPFSTGLFDGGGSFGSFGSSSGICESVDRFDGFGSAGGFDSFGGCGGSIGNSDW